MSQEPTPTSYDVFPYPTQSFAQTHPDRLAVLATLFGLKPPPPDRCRVLELGCATGGNLLPLALTLPECTFLGIDYSARQIQDGRQTLQALGLKNVELRHASILDLGADLGEFDYIICHGVYSWVPEEVQEKLLVLYARHLAADGVGYVSYNTLPGWHMRGMIRDMMCYHVSRSPGASPAERVAQARALLAFLARAARGERDPYGLLLNRELETLAQHADSYLYHEHLEEHNEPLYFFEFNDRLTAKGLRYLGEADLSAMLHLQLPAEVRQGLEQLAPDLIQMEQYLDFVRNRTFRQTLVCHERHRPNYDLRPDKLADVQVASPLRPASPRPDLASPAAEVFQGPGETTLSATEPIFKAALVCLSERWPRTVAFAELLRLARARLGAAAGTPERDQEALGLGLLVAYGKASHTLIEFWLRPPACAAAVGPRPTASPLVRLQAAAGYRVTNLRHQMITLGEFDHQVLPLLDGGRSRAAVLKVLLDNFRHGRITLNRNGRPVTEEHEARAVLAQTLDQQLPLFARSSLLVS